VDGIAGLEPETGKEIGSDPVTGDRVSWDFACSGLPPPPGSRPQPVQTFGGREIPERKSRRAAIFLTSVETVTADPVNLSLKKQDLAGLVCRKRKFVVYAFG
jgi:hypothetical protein